MKSNVRKSNIWSCRHFLQFWNSFSTQKVTAERSCVGSHFWGFRNLQNIDIIKESLRKSEEIGKIIKSSHYSQKMKVRQLQLDVISSFFGVGWATGAWINRVLSGELVFEGPRCSFRVLHHLNPKGTFWII